MPFPFTPLDQVPDLKLQADDQMPRLPDSMQGEALALLAMFDQLLIGLTRRCPHVKCRRKRTCTAQPDICSLAPLAVETREWLAAREARPLFREYSDQLREKKKAEAEAAEAASAAAAATGVSGAETGARVRRVT